ncbi:hypothetical protein HFO32_10720 [Rhizobium leguminosarum]|uniref:hypothetical protein n=1 Tax=Rhizobium leguminosarum TaxID=384 RepID=UPI001C9742DD|nr:hypothetical protein [Rhizobium leguminosarum]MBY5682629.1 hypothetical protein [Rhizobium leguminosarum]
MTVLDFYIRAKAKQLKAGDLIDVDGAKLRVTSAERAEGPPRKLIVGGPQGKMAVGFMVTLEDGRSALLHPAHEVRVIKR